MNLLVEQIITGFGRTFGEEIYNWVRRSLRRPARSEDSTVLAADVDDDDAGDDDGDGDA
ncbi:MAG: hypothetical protein R3A51_08900 [Nannocystaceae bacterium]|nr:hypothetical protein [Myxococcales bacterium]